MRLLLGTFIRSEKQTFLLIIIKMSCYFRETSKFLTKNIKKGKQYEQLLRKFERQAVAVRKY